MEDSTALSPPLAERCYYCSTEVVNDDVFCTNCGYPLKGSELDQKTFVARKNNVSIDLVAFDKRLKNAANSLYYLAGAFVVFGFIYFFLKMNDPDVLAYVLPNFILAIVFLVLGAYSMKKPLACIVSGLSLYVIVLILNAAANPASIFGGIIWKVIIIGYLIKGIKSAIEIEKIKKENNLP
jgi:hypothetical protein